MKAWILILAALVWTPAQANPISADLTEETVQVSADFTGARLSIYGAVDSRLKASTDVVVVARGPASNVRVARKQRVGGLWLDVKPIRFEGAPGFYRAASSRPLEDIAPYATRRKLGLGFNHLPLRAPDQEREAIQYGVPVVINTLGRGFDGYRDALLRLRVQQGLFSVDPRGVRFVDGGLFRADLRLPANAPPGRYTVEILLFRDGKLTAKRARTLDVTRVGLERMAFEAAHSYPWGYGLGCVGLALVVGWGVSRAFQRRWI